jgi:hypothetical protein
MSTQRPLPGFPTPAGRVAQGRRSSNGNAAEDYLDDLHDACELAGIAVVRRVRSNFQILRSLGRGRFEVLMLGKSTVDYHGYLCAPPGQPARKLLIEAKSFELHTGNKGGVAPARLPFGRIEEHQRIELARGHARGALALVVVLFGPALYAVPWPVVAAALAAGKASLLEEDLEPHRADLRRPYLAPWALKETT